MKKYFVVSFVAVVLATVFFVHNVFATDPTPITDCGEINTPGAYILVNDISATGTCITVTASTVTIDGDGYTITGDNGVGDYGIFADTVSTLVVENIDIEVFGVGIYLNGVSGSVITQTDINQMTRYGIYAEGVTELTVTGGNIDNTTAGVSDDGYGIYFLDASDNYVTGTNFSSNSNAGIKIRGDSSSNEISNNIFTSDYYSVSIDACDYNDVDGCEDFIIDTVIQENGMISPSQGGIELSNTNDSDINNNEISGTNISVYLNEISSSNSITENTITSFGTGVYIEDSSEDNTINGNTFTTGNTGVYIVSESDGNIISENNISAVNAGFYIDNSDNTQVTDNIINISNVNFGEGSSSALMYAYNGEIYDYISDIGRGMPRNIVGNDLIALRSDQLAPDGDKYKIELSDEYNEIDYYDELYLTTYDHAPGYNIATSLGRSTPNEIYTISEAPTNPLQSCTDMYGNDCVDALASSDDKWSYKDASNLNEWTMNFGDLSGASRILLSFEGGRDYTAEAASAWTDIYVKNSEDSWVKVYSRTTLSSPAGSPRNQAVDMTGKFLTSNYDVKVAFDRVVVNTFSIDTTPQVEYTAHNYYPSSTNLHFGGFTAIDKTNFWDHDYYTVTNNPPEQFALQTGNFTKYGDVTSLLSATDDQYVIMHYGDRMNVEFDYVPPADGMERDFTMYSWAPYKNAESGELGQKVTPLPYVGMTDYTLDTTGYPQTPENLEYLKTWNTREVTAKSQFGMSLPNSTNTTVTGNVITNDSENVGDTGIFISYEDSSTISDNEISYFDYAIFVEYSQDIVIDNNNIHDTDYDSIQIYDTSDLTISNNIISNATDNADGIQVEGGDNIDITNNTISNTTDDGIFFENASNVTVTGNTVSGIYDNAIDVEFSGPFTIADNTLESNDNGIDIEGNFELLNSDWDFPGAYSGSNVWYSVYNENNAHTFLDRTVDLTSEAVTDASVSFKTWRYTETCCDGLKVLASINGIDWDELLDSRSDAGVWETEEVDLSAYIGEIITLRFEFFTDGSALYPGAGVYLDDFVINDSVTTVEDDVESGVGAWTVTTDSGNPWEITDVGPIEEGEESEVKTITDNDITSSEDFGLSLSGVTEVDFYHNTIHADDWVYNDEEANTFNDEDSGNTYYFANGDGAWTVFDIKDSNRDGYADKGKDLPFDEESLGNDLWNGFGEDEYPATTLKASSSGGASAVSIANFKAQQQTLPVVPTTSDDSTSTTDLELCPADQILTQNLKSGAINGKYHWYTKGIVKDVKILQTHMNRLGFDSGAVDGILGPLTDGAIKRMQKFLGTYQDGMVGPITRELINKSCGAGGLQ